MSSSLKSQFFKYLVAINRPHLDNLKEWIFLPGMLFNSQEKWWGNKGRRVNPHEGLDLCLFEDLDGNRKILHRHTRIPAAFAGEVVKIDRDFLGLSMFLRHEKFNDRGKQLYSAYGHTRPQEFLKIGSQVAEGEIIAVLSEPSGKNSLIRPHVHITFAWVSRLIKIKDLNWETLGKNLNLTLIDPLAVLEPYIPEGRL